MNILTIKLVCNKYNKILSRAETYLKEARKYEQEYYIKYYFNSSLLPTTTKIINYKKIDDGIILTIKDNVNIESFCIFLQKHIFFTNLEKKLFHNKIIFYF